MMEEKLMDVEFLIHNKIIEGIIPLISQVPESAPTKSKIIIAPVTDFKFSAICSIIILKFKPFDNPRTIPTAAPNNNIN